MPGPKEPNDYALNQMLEPIIQDLLQLYSGACLQCSYLTYITD
jgi:hypothetical protein